MTPHTTSIMVRTARRVYQKKTPRSPTTRRPVQRVRRTALVIAKNISDTSPTQIKPDLLVTELAALLHDVLDKKYVSPAEAADPYAFFSPFFESLNSDWGIDLISDGRAHQITKIIENVSWTTEKRLREADLLKDWHRECVELHVVQDADRLDAIGAFGVMRCVAYSAITNRRVYLSAYQCLLFEPMYRALHIPNNDPTYKDSAIEHFHEKLLHIRDRLKTEPGRKMGEKRHKLVRVLPKGNTHGSLLPVGSFYMIFRCWNS